MPAVWDATMEEVRLQLRGAEGNQVRFQIKDTEACAASRHVGVMHHPVGVHLTAMTSLPNIILLT